MREILVLALCACKSAAPTEAPLRNASASPSRLVAIEGVKPLALSLFDGAAQDCRPSETVRRRFRGREVIACGPLARDADKVALEDARGCVERALADQQPFIHEVVLPGVDSEVARALIGVVENGELATYQVFYDSDPCGGGCPARGMTTIEKCRWLVRDVQHADACAVDVTRCYRCEDARPVELCRFGSRPG